MSDEDWICKEYEKLFNSEKPTDPGPGTSSSRNNLDPVHEARLKLVITEELTTKYFNDTSMFLLRDQMNNYADVSSNSKHLDEQLEKFMKERKMTNNSFQFHSNIDNLNIFSQIPEINTNEGIPEEDLKNFHKMFKKKQLAKPVEPRKPRFNRNTGFRPPRPLSELPSNESEINIEQGSSKSGFKTAKEVLELQSGKKLGTAQGGGGNNRNFVGGKRKRNNKFVSPLLSSKSFNDNTEKLNEEPKEEVDERLKNIDPRMVELIRSEIMDISAVVNWNDIAGLKFAKTAIQEAVVWPMLRPDIFKGLRRPPKGILLFGPPGTGKTLIGKCVASQSKSTFFSISASSLTSKWIGDGEKMVRALFAVARCHQPAVIFIDEIDSLLSQRNDSEHESSRRLKTEFLIQLDGATTESEERLLVIGATNRPQEIDEAARRRLVKRLYIPLPELEARSHLVKKLMSTERHSLTEEDVMTIARLSDGYSGADINNLCSDASLGPIRSINLSQIENIQADEVRPVTIDDFKKSLKNIRASVSSEDLNHYTTWDNTYGSGNV